LGLAVAQLKAAGENKQQKAVGQDTSGQEALLMSQLRDVEARLDRVGVVRSPYAGTVKKIKWVGQTDREFFVEINLAVEGQNYSSPALCKTC
jgi:hypothetical protein